MNNKLKFFALIGLTIFLSGCMSFIPSQEEGFIDKNGAIMTVVYGNTSKPYSYTMVSPMNGAEVECTETKVVELTLPAPSKEKVVCYICQNPSPKGTMYESRDKKWRYLTIGVACRLYLWYPSGNDYLLVYEGDASRAALDEAKMKR